jgi:uncharacterized protein YkwD
MASPFRSVFASTHGLVASSLALALVVSGCAAQSAATKREPGTLKDGVFTPMVPPAASYGVDPSLGPCPEGSVVRMVEDMVAKAATKAGKPIPKLDPQLCAMSSALSGWDLTTDLPADLVYPQLLHYFGRPESVVRPVINVVRDEDPAVVAKRVYDGLANIAFTMKNPIYGLTTWRATKKVTGVVLLILDQNIELSAPVPRHLDAGQKATIAGKIVVPGDFEKSAVIVSDVAGTLNADRKPIAESFSTQVSCGDKAGTILVQIRGELPGMATPLANFPIACGSALAVGAVVPPPPPATFDIAATEKELFDFINAERAAIGLAPLTIDVDVAKVARGIAEGLRNQAMGQGGGSPDLPGQLKAAGVVSGLILQNQIRGRSAYEADQQFLASPVHHSNMLNGAASHVGIGVAVLEAKENQPATLYVTELFVKELPEVDVAKVKDALRVAMARKRADARTNELKSDVKLEDVAQKYADALAASKGDVPQAQVEEITAPLYKGYKTVSIMLGARPEVADFAEEPKVVSDGKVVGLGLAQGFHPVLGKNALYVVLLIATPQGRGK